MFETTNAYELRQPIPEIIKGKKIVTDSRQLSPGDVFIATEAQRSPFYRSGEDRQEAALYSFDAHQYIPDVIRNGASVVVLSKPQFLPNRLPRELKVIETENTVKFLGELMRKEIEKTNKRAVGVTGSTGKSSLCEMTAVALGAENTYKHLSDRPTPISIPVRALNSPNFYTARKVVVEMPMDGLNQINQLCQIAPPDIGIILNINSSHIVQLGSIENIVKAKMELAYSLKESGVILLNTDDPHLTPWVEKLRREGVSVLTFGTQDGSFVRIGNVSRGSKGFNVNLEFQGRKEVVHSPYIGREISYSLAAAVAAAIIGGENFSVICKRLSDMDALPGRMSVLKGHKGETILDDTRLATPQSTERLLQMLTKIQGKRKILIQGPILRHYQHGRPEDKILKLMRKFNRVILYQSDAWLANHHSFPLVKEERQLIEWYQKNVSKDDLVIINGSEGIKMWEVVQKLVRGDQIDRVYNPEMHD